MLRGTTQFGCSRQPSRSNSHDDHKATKAIGGTSNAVHAAQTTGSIRAFPWAARKGTSAAYRPARVSIIAPASLLANPGVLSFVDAF